MNWKHSFYQIYAITFGQSFTIDEAYRLLHELKEDRLFAIASAFAETSRAKAKVVDAKTVIEDFAAIPKGLKAQKHRSDAALLETEARFIIAQPCLDMARAELAFIENCISQIDENQTIQRMFTDFATGSQMVQSLEYAYDYTWSLIYEGPHSELMKNIYINPYAQAILSVAGECKREDLPSRELVANKLAAPLKVPSECLAVSVKVQNDMLSTDTNIMLTYQASHVKSMIDLRKKADEQLSRTGDTSIGVKGSS